MGSCRNSLWHLGPALTGGLILLCCAALFTAASLKTSKEIGRLSTITNYDDVVYFNKASEIYFLGANQGAVAAAGALLTQNLHAPFPVFAGVFGFLLFGPSVERAYYVLALVVFALLAFVAAITRSLPPLIKAALVIGTLAFPFATMCAQQFRPDMMWAVVLGGSCTLLLASERPFERKLFAVAFGVAVGLVLLIKPSTFAMTLLVMGGTWFLSAAIALLTGGVSFRDLGIRLALAIASAMAVAGWYWVQHGREIFDYFFVNSFGDNREVWEFHGSLWDQLTYYVAPGKALASNLGNFFYPLLAIFLTGSLVDLARGETLAVRLRAAAFLWMLAGTCVVNAAFSMKSPYLGGSFYGFLIFGAAWYAVRLLRCTRAREWLRPLWRQAVFAGVVLAFCATAFSFPPVCVVSKKIRKVQTSVNNGVLRDLLAASGANDDPTLVVTQANPIVPQYFEIEFRARNRKLTMISAALAHRREEVLRFTRDASYVLLQDPGLSGRPEGNDIPAEKLQPELLALFRADPAWHLAGTYPDGAGKFAYLFQRNQPDR